MELGRQAKIYQNKDGQHICYTYNKYKAEGRGTSDPKILIIDGGVDGGVNVQTRDAVRKHFFCW